MCKGSRWLGTVILNLKKTNKATAGSNEGREEVKQCSKTETYWKESEHFRANDHRRWPLKGVLHGDNEPHTNHNKKKDMEAKCFRYNSVAQSCPTLCDPMNRSTPGLPVRHQLPEFTQTHVHQVGDAIQPSHPLSFPFPPAPNPSQHQGLFQWVNSSHEVAKVLELQPFFYTN